MAKLQNNDFGRSLVYLFCSVFCYVVVVIDIYGLNIVNKVRMKGNVHPCSNFHVLISKGVCSHESGSFDKVVSL